VDVGDRGSSKHQYKRFFLVSIAFSSDKNVGRDIITGVQDNALDEDEDD
jgi:hypothetical protein